MKYPISRIQNRESSNVIARSRRDSFACHCEAAEGSRSNPKTGSEQAAQSQKRDCFASLAMTGVLILLLASCILLPRATNAWAKEEAPAVILKTQAVTTKQPGIVALGDISITALKSNVISVQGALLLKIPADFPGVWDEQVTTLSLSQDSLSGFVNEAVKYHDEKTLIIGVTQTWPKNTCVTITNLRIDIPELPTYEELFSGKLTNYARLNLRFGDVTQRGNAEASQPLLLKIAPLYMGDDGWAVAESYLFPKTLERFSITNITPSYASEFLVERGFTAEVHALDANDNFIASATDNILLSSYLSTDPDAPSQVNFYTDNTYATLQPDSTYSLSSGKVTIYAKDATIEEIVLKTTQTEDSRITGISDSVGFSPYRYSVTSNNPELILNEGWQEEVQLQDGAGQAITTPPPSQVILASDGNIKFYPDSNYTAAEGEGSLTYNLTNGKCTIYMKGAVNQTVHLQVDDTYGSLSHEGGGVSRTFIIMTVPIDTHLDFAYVEEDDTTDKLTIRAWLEKDGLTVTTDLGVASLAIYDSSTLKYTLEVNSVPSDGIYWFTKQDTGLSAGQGYFALATIKYKDQEYQGGGGFYVTMDKQVLSLVEEISAKIEELKTKTGAIGDEVVEGITPTLSDIGAKTDRAVTATEVTIPAKMDTTRDELKPIFVSHILNTETMVPSGESLIIRYRTLPDTNPVLNVYGPERVLLLTDKVMTATTTTVNSSIYEYEVNFDTSWGKGFFTIICSEETYGTLDGITVSVIGTSLDKISRDISSVLGSTSNISAIGETQDIIDERFTQVTSKLSDLNVTIVDAVAETVGAIASQIGKKQSQGIYLMMTDINDDLKVQGEAIHGDIEQLYDVSELGTASVNYLRNKFIEMKNLLAINMAMVESVTYEPIIQTWYEYR